MIDSTSSARNQAGRQRWSLALGRGLSQLLGLTGPIVLAAGLALGVSGCATSTGSREAPADQPASQQGRQDGRRSVERDVWARLSRQFALPMPTRASERARVQHYVDFYLGNGNIVLVSLTRAEPWVEHLLGELERRGLPGELFLVPLIESGFAATATSRSGAAGIWQFMPATGAHFGLRQTAAFDGRRDVFASSEAALEYFELLYARFGDWPLVLAAFNHGQGNVARAMEANQRAGRRTDYWSLELSNDAMSYVPRILALRQLIAGRRVPLPPYRPEHAVVGVPIDAAIDLQQVAAMTHLSLDELRSLNPATRTTVLPSMPGVRLALPRAALPRLAEHDVGARRRHRDPIETARQALQAAAIATPAGPEQNGAAPAALSGSGSRVHIVQPGESLWGIAAGHGVDLGELGEINALPRGATLSPGQRLILPASASLEAAPILHRVQPGETLSAISRRYGVSLDVLRQANHIPGDLLRAGETLLIPRPRH